MSTEYYCNPINVPYRYQFNQDPRLRGKTQICREAADPSMIMFKGKYYIFASMNLSVWVSDDLVTWQAKRLPEDLPLYDYAPDARVMGDYVYLCASNREHNCDYYRTKDIENGPYEKIPGTFAFWDPNMFIDDDGKVYFYWGCSNQTPIYGTELDPETLKPVGGKVEILYGDSLARGYERVGDNNSQLPAGKEEVDASVKAFMKKMHVPSFLIPKKVRPLIRGMFTREPYIEGAWMTKHDGKYYLQYACPGAQYTTYGDGVMVGDAPLGPFKVTQDNPFSYKPGGFIPGAGHGSTMEDKNGNWWHTSTESISVNHDFERRVGIWPAGFDQDGVLFCNQRYGDWPVAVPVDDGNVDGAAGSSADGDRHDNSEERNNAAAQNRVNPWADPSWYLLSYGKGASASSSMDGHDPSLAVNEDVHNWWRPATADRSEWLSVDLGKAYDVHAVQVNFADDVIDIPVPGKVHPGSQARYIEERDSLTTQWKLEASLDGENWTVLEDKSKAQTDLPHDLIVRPDGFQARYLRISNMHVPYDQIPCISGIRVFGLGDGAAPAAPVVTVKRMGDLDMEIRIRDGAAEMTADSSAVVDGACRNVMLSPAENAHKNTGNQSEVSRALGYNILWGNSKDKLYHSFMVFAGASLQKGRREETQYETDANGVETVIQRVGALMKDQKEYWVRVDAFNENGITEGQAVSI